MAPFWRDTDRSAVTVTEAISEWALVAWDVLEAVAARWRRTIDAEALGAEVQRRSGIHTDLPAATWIGPLLSLVTQRAHESHGPAVTSLVAGEDGGPHECFDEALTLAGTPGLTGLARRDAWLDARMACHRAYGAKIPAGVTELPRPRVRKVVEAAAPAPERVAPVCPRCFLQLPATGVCDDCEG